MTATRLELTRWQFELTWSLAELHFAELAIEDFLWEPSEYCWTVRRGVDGKWRPDWQVPEPDPVPVCTIGWLSWHIGWWWTGALEQTRATASGEQDEVTWPGDGTSALRWLRDLRRQWTEVLEGLTDAELDAETEFPWPADSGLTLAHTLNWVNVELMKNVAEIGNLRLLRLGRGTS